MEKQNGSTHDLVNELRIVQNNYLHLPICPIRSCYVQSRVRPRFFDQVGHETMYASSGNKHFFTKSCHHQTYQNYEQSQQKLGTILENKVS